MKYNIPRNKYKTEEEIMETIRTPDTISIGVGIIKLIKGISETKECFLLRCEKLGEKLSD